MFGQRGAISHVLKELMLCIFMSVDPGWDMISYFLEDHYIYWVAFSAHLWGHWDMDNVIRTTETCLSRG